jgi:hypothetical protein
MGISTFGGAVKTSASLVNGVIGAPILAPTGFTSTDYVDAGATFNATTYPSLAAAYPPNFYGDTWKKVNAPSVGAALSTSTTGTFLGAFKFGTEFYVLFSKGHVFKTTGGVLSTLAYYKQIPILQGVGVAFVGVAGPNLYVTYNTTPFQIQVFTESTLTNVTISPSAPVAAMSAVRYGNGVWVAYNASANGNTYYRSTDGVTFTSSTIPATTPRAGMEYGNGIWSCVCTSAAVYTSTDAISWTARTSLATAPAVGLMRFNGLNFVAICNTSAHFSSPDGITWTARTGVASTQIGTLEVGTTGASFTSQNIYPTGGANTTAIEASADGITWLNRSSTFSSGNGAQFLNNQYFRAFGSTIVVFGTTATTGQWLMSSSTDNLATLSTPVALYGVGLNANLFPPAVVGTTMVTVENLSGTATSGAAAYGYSTNGGSTWTVGSLPVSNIAWKGCFSTPTKCIIWGTSVAGVTLLSTPDGVTWTTKTIATQSASTTVCFNYGETIYFAFNTVLTSTPDYGTTINTFLLPAAMSATTSTLIVTPSGALIMPVTTGGGYYSLNGGASWTSASWAGLAGSVVGVACAGPKAAIVTLNLTPFLSYMLSVDGGATWQTQTFPVAIAASAKALFYVNGYYFVYLGNNVYYYSADAINWTSMSTGTTSDFIQPWNQATVSNGLPYLGGPGNTLLVGDNTTYHVPYIQSSVPGTKYVIKAQ